MWFTRCSATRWDFVGPWWALLTISCSEARREIGSGLQSHSPKFGVASRSCSRSWQGESPWSGVVPTSESREPRRGADRSAQDPPMLQTHQSQSFKPFAYCRCTVISPWGRAILDERGCSLSPWQLACTITGSCRCKPGSVVLEVFLRARCKLVSATRTMQCRTRARPLDAADTRFTTSKYAAQYS